VLLVEIAICFMPHCPRILYENLLETNWKNGCALGKMYIFGNSFDEYLQWIAQSKSSWIQAMKDEKIAKEVNLEIGDAKNRDAVAMNAFAFQKLIYFQTSKM